MIKTRYLKYYILGVLCIISKLDALAQSDLFVAPERGFTSWLPAPDWEHALLTGNGTIGALVFGNPHEETIILSHGQLFLPQEKSDSLINQAARLDDIQTLIREGKYQEATKIPVELREEAGYTDQRDPFIPAFDIKITQEPANIRKYVRSTDFQTGEAKTTWTDDTGTFQRKLFVSRADSIVVLIIQADQPINCTIGFQHRLVEWNQWGFVGEHVEEMTAAAEGSWLTYKSNFKKKYKGSLEGYEGLGRLIINGGSSEVNGNNIQIKGAKEILLLVKIAPNYDYKDSQIPELKRQLTLINNDYDRLLKNHSAIHAQIFNRMKLDLHSKAENKMLHIEELLLKAQQKGPPKALIEKVFDAGRYNILSSTGTNPPNLQGIWSGTWTAPWSAGYTHDGNLPSAMSVVMAGNMPELMYSYVDYLEKYIPDFEENAKRLFGTRGINLPGHTTTSGRPTDFNETWCLSLWTGGAGWAADIIYDYYRYTGDKAFLKDHTYPWLKKTAWFYEDFLQDDTNGTFIFNPSYSPENRPAHGNSQATINATMDVMITRQVMRHAIEAGKILGEDKNQLNKWQTMLTKLPEYQVNAEGVLREWLWPGLEDNYRHRHVSQLYSLYNSMDPDIIEDEVLKMGAEKLIEKKLAFRKDEAGGEMAFGLVQLGLSAAHLRNGEKAHEAVKWLASKYWSTGLGSFHNVGGLLNTDISGGLSAVIIQMLVYSEVGEIYLLPALPRDWSEGSISGALLRNQITVNELSWNKNSIMTTLVSKKAQKVVVKLPSAISSVSVSPTDVAIKRLPGDTMIELSLPAEKDVRLNIEMR